MYTCRNHPDREARYRIYRDNIEELFCKECAFEILKTHAKVKMEGIHVKEARDNFWRENHGNNIQHQK